MIEELKNFRINIEQLAKQFNWYDHFSHYNESEEKIVLCFSKYVSPIGYFYLKSDSNSVVLSYEHELSYEEIKTFNLLEYNSLVTLFKESNLVIKDFILKLTEKV